MSRFGLGPGRGQHSSVCFCDACAALRAYPTDCPDSSGGIGQRSRSCRNRSRQFLNRRVERGCAQDRHRKGWPGTSCSTRPGRAGPLPTPVSTRRLRSERSGHDRWGSASAGSRFSSRGSASPDGGGAVGWGAQVGSTLGVWSPAPVGTRPHRRCAVAAAGRSRSRSGSCSTCCPPRLPA